MGRLVLQVLSVHLDTIGARVPGERQEKRPYGALCMAIQAVSLVLKFCACFLSTVPLGQSGTGVLNLWQDVHAWKRGPSRTLLTGELG